jgi:hypothetical protein
MPELPSKPYAVPEWPAIPRDTPPEIVPSLLPTESLIVVVPGDSSIGHDADGVVAAWAAVIGATTPPNSSVLAVTARMTGDLVRILRLPFPPCLHDSA